MNGSVVFSKPVPAGLRREGDVEHDDAPAELARLGSLRGEAKASSTDCRSSGFSACAGDRASSIAEPSPLDSRYDREGRWGVIL